MGSSNCVVLWGVLKWEVRTVSFCRVLRNGKFELCCFVGCFEMESSNCCFVECFEMGSSNCVVFVSNL
jgi:hypothetical protein